jgi:DNA (cytosine-5)-methyltransferase 1
MRESPAFFDGGYAWFKVKSNEASVGELQTVYNFEVEHDNSYCVENVIVHNCQPFSIAGNGEGFKDTVKGNLFYDILKIVDKKTPPMCILENVKNLKTHDKGNTYKTIVAELTRRGYLVTSKVINASEYGSPQARHRIFIVATKGKPFAIPEGSGIVTPVRSILDSSITADELNRAKYTLQEKDNADKEAKPGKPHILYDVFPIPSEKKKAAKAAAKEATKEATAKEATKEATAANTLEDGGEEEEKPKGGRQGERVYSVDAVGITVCASSGGPGAKTGLYKVGDAIRRLSVGETLKMFGFPDTFVFPDTSAEDSLFYLGNSIVVDVPKAFVPVVEAWFTGV